MSDIDAPEDGARKGAIMERKSALQGTAHKKPSYAHRRVELLDRLLSLGSGNITKDLFTHSPAFYRWGAASPEARMKVHRDEILLRRFRLCRADIVATLADSVLPPNPQSLRTLADLQLSIMAVEAAMRDKADPNFACEFLTEAAA